MATKNENILADATIPTNDASITEKPQSEKTTLNAMMQEKGASGTKLFGGMIYEEYNPKLQGQKAFTVYEEMRRSDAQVQATLLAMELPIRSTLWNIQPGETTGPAGETETTKKDYEIAAFVEDAIFSRMETTFDDFIRQVLTMLPFGFSIFEKVYKEENGKIYIRKLSQRLARTVWQWKRNDSGRPWIVQFVPMNDENKPANIEIPAEKILVFSFRREGENFEGVSVLRSAYKHWYIKDTLYKLDAVLHERQAVGIPVLTLPDIHDDSDETEAQNILENLRATEKSYIILPGEKWKFQFADMGSGKVIDSEKSIAHHNREIAKNILAQFLELGSGGNGGSYSLSEDQSSLFMLSLTAIAKQIAEKVNRELIQELVDLNFDIAENQSYPKLCFNKLGEVDYTKLSGALSTLAGAGVLTPDEDLESHVRKIFDLPKKLEEEEGENDLDDTSERVEDDTEELDTAAQEEAEQEESDATSREAKMTPEEEAAAAEIELSTLEKELSALEASELANIAMNIGGEFSENEIASSIFKTALTDETKQKISDALKNYWDRKGRKTPDDIRKAGDNARGRAQSAQKRITEQMDSFKKALDPLKKKMEEIRKIKDSIGAGKKEPAKRAQIRAMANEIKAEIKRIRDEKDAQVKGLRSIKKDAYNTLKLAKEEVATRKNAMQTIIKQIRDDVKSKNASRSASIKMLSERIRENAEIVREMYADARARAQGLKGQAKKDILENARVIASGVKNENESLRNAARTLRDEAKKDREIAKSKIESEKKSAGFTDTDAQALGFADVEDMQAFTESKKLFDPSVILKVQKRND